LLRGSDNRLLAATDGFAMRLSITAQSTSLNRSPKNCQRRRRRRSLPIY